MTTRTRSTTRSAARSATTAIAPPRRGSTASDHGAHVQTLVNDFEALTPTTLAGQEVRSETRGTATRFLAHCRFRSLLLSSVLILPPRKDQLQLLLQSLKLSQSLFLLLPLSLAVIPLPPNSRMLDHPDPRLFQRPTRLIDEPSRLPV